MNRDELLKKYYLSDNRITIDSQRKTVTSEFGTFSIGDKVRYTDEMIDLANSVKSPTYTKITKKLTDFYKKTWTVRFMTVVGFEADDKEIVLVGYPDELTKKFDTHICHLSSLQLVTEAESLLYEGK